MLTTEPNWEEKTDIELIEATKVVRVKDFNQTVMLFRSSHSLAKLLEITKQTILHSI